MLQLDNVIEELIDLAVAKGMSRRTAKRHVAKLVQAQWKDGKIDIYGSRDSHGSLEVIPPEPDLILVQEPAEQSH
jgi:hypothetical protein